MSNDSSSLQDEIRNYEERLAHNPDSLLFARLAELYLNAGQLDDAIRVAKSGEERYPGYVVGQRILARACFKKGLLDESRDTLTKITQTFPEDIESQKLLGRILSDQGNYKRAIKVFSTALEYHPNDVECISELELLERRMIFLPADAVHNPFQATSASSAILTGFAALENDPEDSIIDDLEIIELSEADIVAIEEDEQPGAETFAAEQQHDPLFTATLAELYVQQGFTGKALEVYHTILASAPDNDAIRSRIALLEMNQAAEMTATSTSAQSRSEETIAILERWLGNVSSLKAEMNAGNSNSHQTSQHGSYLS